MKEKLSSNQIKTENQLYNLELALKDKIDDLSVQKTPTENELNTIQEGIVSNSIKIMAESELLNVKFDKLEKLCESLVEKNEKNSQLPNQPHPIVQTPVDEHNDINQLNDSMDLSSVQNRTLETSQTMENAKFYGMY